MREMLDLAVAKRKGLTDAFTNAVRWVDGAGDGLPGVVLESFAGRLLLSTSSAPDHPELVDWLQRQRSTVYWKKPDPHLKEAPMHLDGPTADAPFTILENGLRFEVSFRSGHSQGIFLDQRDNRARLMRLMQPGMRMLNTFAYTGAFSVAAARGGAETTTLDLSQPSLDWAKRNFTHNALDPAAHHFCKGDTFHWLQRFARQGRQFDAVVLDPPTFSRDDRGRIFRAERNFGDLAALAARVLSPGGRMLCCTNFRGITAHAFERLVLSGLPRPMRATLAPMPPDFTDVPYLKSLWLEG
jgi:23S rRNA (cytosine1962-C5)-methyltransferase